MTAPITRSSAAPLDCEINSGSVAGYDLPGQAVSVLQPAARAFLAAVAQLLPEPVDFALTVAHDLKGDRFAELELRSAVERGEGLPFEFERDHHDGARFLAVDVAAVAVDLFDPRIGEDRDVEIRRFFGLC